LPFTLNDSVQNSRPVVEARELYKKFGRFTALNNINFTVNKGDFVTIFGPNGAGKTTFLNIAAMVMAPSEGTLLYDGQPANTIDCAARKNIGFISHSTYLYHNLTARENLRFYGKLYGINGLESRIDHQLDAVGLSDRADDESGKFSRGMQQRLTIARAFLHDPAIVLLDEPYTGLDKNASEMLNNVIMTYNSPERAGIMTTHNIEQGYDIATHVAIIRRGKLRYFAATKDISRSEMSTIYSAIVK
jgi:heme exporter protein A